MCAKLFLLSLILLPTAEATFNRGRACSRAETCAIAVSGRDYRMCRAYVEHEGCKALTGIDQAWCQVIVEKKTCYEVVLGPEQEQCEEDQFPGSHLYWKACGEK
jgi:hypothetical protein